MIPEYDYFKMTSEGIYIKRFESKYNGVDITYRLNNQYGVDSRPAL